MPLTDEGIQELLELCESPSALIEKMEEYTSHTKGGWDMDSIESLADAVLKATKLPELLTELAAAREENRKLKVQRDEHYADERELKEALQQVQAEVEAKEFARRQWAESAAATARERDACLTQLDRLRAELEGRG